ncbi:hypothetical protein UPYG_G00347210 [Umbra pygmaea]|uniref:Myb-like domain-containing protein n=1 Tax=Umbra pygmaea TaxID=75934 RepID=A0ABD0VYI9_UMBPY
MDRNRKGNDKDPLIPISFLRLLAPPLQLLSAAMWQVVQKGLVRHYGMLEEFVTSVTEMVPELLSYQQRAQLILGLRARLVLELCRGDHQVDLVTIQPHLDRIKASMVTPRDHSQVTDAQVEESGASFLDLVQTLLTDPDVKRHFFQEVFPVQFGQQYDTALEMLLWEFLSRLEELLPVPDFAQMVSWLGAAPSVLDECLHSATPPEEMKALIDHHRNLGTLDVKDARSIPMDNLILSSLALPPDTKTAMVAHIQTLSAHLQESTSIPNRENKEENIEIPIAKHNVENCERKIPERTRQRINGERERSGKDTPLDEETTFMSASCQPEDICTIDLSLPELVGSDDSEQSSIWQQGESSMGGEKWRGQTFPRKRKLSDSLEVPRKLQADTRLFQDSPVNMESSRESPLISIWGDYTDAAYPVTTDTKVPWSDDETLNLLDIWGKDSVQHVLKGCVKNRHVFSLISKRMIERGYMRTVEQCQTRIKRLKNSFRQSLQQKVECKFYDQLQQILGNVSPPTVTEVTYDVEEVRNEQVEDTEDWVFLGHSGLEEMGTRSVPWTDSETLALINIWGEDKMQHELRSMHRNGQLFAVISSKMAGQGFTRTAEQCQTRVKRLKASFRQCYENNMKGKEQVECKFYDLLERILGNELPSYVEVSENCPDMDVESTEGWPADNECSVYSYQDREAAVGLPDDRKKIPWADGETMILLDLWGDDNVQHNLKRCPHNGHIYSEISEKLNFRGFYRTAEQCHTRIKRLKSSYRQCQESISSSGTERVDFKFYDILKQILERQPPQTSTVMDLTNDLSEESNNDSLQVSAESDDDNNKMSERTSPGSWSDPETLALIDIWGEDDVQKVLRGLVHNGHVYNDISEKMHDRGFSRSPEQCRWKVKFLRNNFRQCYDRKKHGRQGLQYKFYNELEEILGQEAVSIDEYDDRDDQPLDQDLGSDGVRSNLWTEPETLALIELWGDDQVQGSLRGCVRNGHIFAEISEKLASMGHLKTAEQCHSRVKRLRDNYHQCLRSGRNRGEPSMFRYHSFLEPVLGNSNLSGDAEIVDLCDDVPSDDEDRSYASTSFSYTVTEASRKMPWSDRETQALLEVWGEDRVQLSLRGCLKNRHVFEYISQRMMAQGFIRTAEQCHTRVKRLKASFHHDKRECKYYDQMEEIFSRELNVESLAVESLDNEEAAVCESPLDVEQMEASRRLTDGTKFPWSDDETKVLLSIWGSDEVQEDLKGCTRNKHIFSEISQAMANQGYVRTAEQCQSRVKRLKANFRQFCEGKRVGGEKVECKFYDQFVHIFKNKYVTCDSLAEGSHGAADGGEVPGSPETGNCLSPWGPDLSWSVEETEALLDIWGSERIQEVLRGNTGLDQIYSEIAQMMVGQGLIKTAKQCQLKATQLNLSIVPIS